MLHRYVLGVFASALLIASYTIAQFSPTLAWFISNFAPVVFSLSAVVASIYVSRHYGLRGVMPRCFMYFSMGLFFWFLSETTWAIYLMVLGIVMPHLSIADAFYSAGYIFVALGIVTYLRAFHSSFGLRKLILASALAITVEIAFTIGAIGVFSTSLGYVIDFFGFEYPIIETTALFLSTVLVVVFRRGDVGRTWYLVAGALVMNVAADLLWGYTTTRGLYRVGNPLEMLYDFAYMFMAFGLYEHTRIV